MNSNIYRPEEEKQPPTDSPVLERLLEILNDGQKLSVSKLGCGYEIRYSRMYDSPALNSKILIALADLFGTDDIEVDGISESGCETCDYGSRYGHELLVKNATKGTEELDKLEGIENLYCNQQ